jgi:aldehyde oxidoreductase
VYRSTEAPLQIEARLRINQREVNFCAYSDASLLDALRDNIGLTGAKRGCDIGTCGTCTVLVNGKARKSCSLSLRQVVAEQSEVITVEGLAKSGELTDLQRAFIDYGAVQCGYCTPGLLMATEALLQRNADPDRDEINQMLRGQLCRCTGYQPIVDAIRAVAENRPNKPPMATTIGLSCPRDDAEDKVTGSCLYTPDRTREAMLHGVVLRSDKPHAAIVGIDSSAALAIPGVHRVLTHEDVPGELRFGNAIPDMPSLCREKVRFVGDALAIIIADDQRIARLAADRVQVHYRELEALTDPTLALHPEAPKVHATGNLASEQHLIKGEAATALRRAEVVLTGTYQTPFQEHACLEVEAALAWIEGEELIIESPSQNVYFDRREVARVTGWPKRSVIIRQQPMGAAFGKREDLYCQHHAALASIAMGGQPVKIEMSREDTFLATTKRHPFVMKYTVGANRDGKIVALQADLLADTGAYASWAPNILRKALVHGAGAYAIEHVSIDARSVYTNNSYSGAFRGFGAPQVFFAIESMIDEVAQALAMPPTRVREINSLKLGSRTATNQELTASVGLPECLRRVNERLHWTTHQGLSEDGQWLQGVGLAIGFYGIGYGNGIPDIGSAVLELCPGGEVALRISAVDYGQGSNTVFPQITCFELGIPASKLKLTTGDTSICPDSGSTVASRQTYVSGNAVRLACEKFRSKLCAHGAKQWGCEPTDCLYSEGEVRGPGGVLSLMELAEQGAFKTQARFRASTGLLDPHTGQGNPYWPYAYGAQGVELSVHRQTGKVRLDRIVAAQDVGHALNPQMVDGQIRGAIAMGLGLALFEEYRVVDGVPQDRNFDSYRIPQATDLPPIEVLIVEEHEPTGPYGAKGVGEPPIVPTAPAIANAIANATGHRFRKLPIHPEEIREALAASAVP